MSGVPVRDLIEQIIHSLDPHDQKRGIDAIIASDGTVQNHILEILEKNPFILTKEVSDHLHHSLSGQDFLNSGDAYLVLLRQLSMHMQGHRIVVFCAPKSGSSFTASALYHATGYRPAGLTSYTVPAYAARLGMNGREQELDEFALIYQILKDRGNFVAQHHTKCTPFLCNQIRTFNILPVVTYRNIYDSLVSFDEMMMKTRKARLKNRPLIWFRDSSITLPENYQEIPLDERLDFLAHTLGVWIINYFVSWKRCERLGLVSPLWLNYTRDILDQSRFVEKIGSAVLADAESRDRLAAYWQNPDPFLANYNKGTAGRGEAVPDGARRFLETYAGIFRDELAAPDLEDLLEVRGAADTAAGTAATSQQATGRAAKTGAQAGMH